MDVTEEQIRQALSESQRAVVELMHDEYIARPSPNFGFTFAEYAQKARERGEKISEETARTRLNKLVAQGKLDVKEIRVPKKEKIYFVPGTWPA